MPLTKSVAWLLKTTKLEFPLNLALVESERSGELVFCPAAVFELLTLNMEAKDCALALEPAASKTATVNKEEIIDVIFAKANSRTFLLVNIFAPLRNVNQMRISCF